MMSISEFNILRPNTGNDTQAIFKNHVFVAVTDYGLVLLLREIRVKYGEVNSKWIWLKMRENDRLTIGSEEREYISFDVAINKLVNDPYLTVYDFCSYDRMIQAWAKGKIKYEDNIKTVYEGKVERK